MERNRHHFLSPAAAEQRPLPVCRNRASSDIMSPASQVTVQSSSCSSRVLGPPDFRDREPGHNSHQYIARNGMRGSLQAKPVQHGHLQHYSQHHLMNTSLPLNIRRSHDASVLSSVGANSYHNQNVSCPVKGKNDLKM